MIDGEKLKDIVCEIRKEYFTENGFDNGVDYMANEVIDAISNMQYESERNT